MRFQKQIITSLLIGFANLWIGVCSWGDESAHAKEQSVRKAVEYLSREVATWHDEHHCYSCHNHGDGARALFAAAAQTRGATTPSIRIAKEWLTTPDRWDKNGPDGPFSDRHLARIQFAAALTEGIERGIITDRKPLRMAAEQLIRDQQESGAWEFTGADALGSPTTYGRALATVLARRTVLVADEKQFEDAVRRADAWLRHFDARSVTDAAAILWGLRGASDEPAVGQRRRCIATLQRGQGDDGGWGPYVTAGPEPFDTALAVLALASETDGALKESIARGQAFLVALQQPDGSWPETTRPLPRESYSQRMSTTAWATMALLVP